jgi:hypothetical protein
MKKSLLFVLSFLLCTASVFAAEKKVAFVYRSGYGSFSYSPSIDPIHTALASAYSVTDFAYAAKTDYPDTATLKTYDLVVLSEAIDGASTLGNALVNLVGKVPVLNMKAYHYTSGRWSWATPSNPTAKTTSVTINSGFESHDIFSGVTTSSGVVEIFNGTSTASNLMQGFSSITSSMVQTDKIIANLTGTTTYAIHEITNLAYKYMLIPISSDCISTVSSNGVKLVLNACDYLMGGGSGFDPDAAFKIAYLYDSSHSGYCGIANDPIYNNTVIAEKDCQAIDIKDFTAESTDTLAGLENFDLVVVSDAMSSDHPFAKLLGKEVNRVPMLNLKSSLYTPWNYGSGQNPSDAATLGGVPTIKVQDGFMAHPLFVDLDVDADSTVNLFTNATGVLKNLVQGYTANADGLFASDSLVATVTGAAGTYNAIHVHGTTNKYLLIPIASDAIYLDDAINLSDNAMQMLNNAVYYLAATKATVVAAQKPTFSLTYQNNVTKVAMATATSDGSIYYTIDGTTPTTSSSLYSDTISITSDCTVKALTFKQGLNNSVVDSVVVTVKTQLAEPSISVVADGAGKMVTITAAEGASIYYTISGATPAAATATSYSSGFVVTRPCRVKAIAVMDGKLNSEIASDTVDIAGYVARNKTLVWANFYDQPSTWSWANTDSTTATTGDVIAKYTYSSTTPVRKTVVFANGFLVGSLGQRINLQTTAAAISGNYSPYTDGDTGASSYAMSFLTTSSSTDPTTAYMFTPQAYRGPFDVVVWFTGAKANTAYTEKLEISIATDTAGTWTVLDTLSSLSDKFMRKRFAYYDGTDSVYVKLASVSNIGTNSNMMIFDMKVMGQGQDPLVSVQTPTIEKEVLSSHIYTISGIEVRRLVFGLNIVKTIYSDGSVETKKIMVKDPLVN